MTRTAVIFGGPSPEHDISILTGLQAGRSLSAAGDEPVVLYWDKSGTWWRVPVETEAGAFLAPPVAGAVEVELSIPGGFAERKRLRSAGLEIEVALNCCHGGPGEDGTLSGLLGLAGIATSGPYPEIQALLMDKAATGAFAASIGVPTIETHLVQAAAEQRSLPSTPWVTKPRYGGSSVGVEVDVDDINVVAALARNGAGRAGMVVQPYLRGWTDLNISVRRNHGVVEVSEIERPIKSADGHYTYEEKYLAGGGGVEAAPRELPAVLPPSVRDQIVQFATSLAASLPLTGAPRIDFMWDGAAAVVLCEINAIPGAWGNHLWRAVGVERNALYTGLLAEAAAAGPQRPQWIGKTDGRALRASGSIASKLA